MRRWHSIIGSFLLFPMSLSVASELDEKFRILNESNVLYYSEYAADIVKVPWKILVYGSDMKMDTLSVTNSETGARLFSLHHELLGTDKFVSLEVLDLPAYENPVMAVKWTRGAHGEKIYLIDPGLEGDGVLRYYTSFWPIRYEITGGQIILEVSDSKNMTKLIRWPGK